MNDALFVPREPTRAMLDHAQDVVMAGAGMSWEGRSPQAMFAQAWKAMIAASPAPILSIADNGSEVAAKADRRVNAAYASMREDNLARRRAEKRAELAASDERLRFEGDLDKWMKILGAGITGYQPEAYAVMDAACRELVEKRLARETELLRVVCLLMSIRDYRYGFVDANVREAINACLDEHPDKSFVSVAVKDVVAERRRQVEAEGWTPEHDDTHKQHELALAARVYADPFSAGNPFEPGDWPWEAEAYKAGSYRQNLVKAGALILAEIERLDRKL